MQNDKPIIRHCRNCKYWQMEGVLFDCPVIYQTAISFPRLKALFCKYYKTKEGSKDAE